MTFINIKHFSSTIPFLINYKRTFAWTVSYELLSFWIFFLILFVGRALE